MTKVTTPNEGTEQTLILDAPARLNMDELQVVFSLIRALDDLHSVLDLIRREPNKLIGSLTVDLARKLIMERGVTASKDVSIEFKPSDGEPTIAGKQDSVGAGSSSVKSDLHLSKQLWVTRLSYGSPIEISLGGWIPELLEAIRQLIKDREWRNKHEKRLAELEEAQKYLELEQKSLELQTELIQHARVVIDTLVPPGLDETAKRIIALRLLEPMSVIDQAVRPQATVAIVALRDTNSRDGDTEG